MQFLWKLKTVLREWGDSWSRVNSAASGSGPLHSALTDSFSYKENPFPHVPSPQRKLQVNYRQAHKPVHKLTLSGAIIQNINKVQ